MSLTVNLVRGPKIAGDLLWAAADVTFDDSYSSGGEALTPADFGFTALEPHAQMIQVTASPSGGFNFEYDFANQKLKVRVPGVAIGAAGSATLDDYPLSGTGATTTSIGLKNDASSPVRFGPQQEVGAVDLSSVTVRVLAFASK